MTTFDYILLSLSAFVWVCHIVTSLVNVRKVELTTLGKIAGFLFPLIVAYRSFG